VKNATRFLGAMAGGAVLAASAACAVPTSHPEKTAVQIITDGTPRAAIVLSAQAAPDEQFAARELNEHLKLMTGVELPVVADRPGAGAKILLGSAAAPELAARVREKGSDPAAFGIEVAGDTIAIAGLSPEGTLFGVYELLEQVGCRWYMPGEFGRVVPKSATVGFRPQRTVQVPSFAGRWFTVAMGSETPGGQWQRRARMGGPFFPSAHGIAPFKATSGDKLFEEHPEYFSLNDGKRTKRQVCLSNPDVLRLAVAQTKTWFRANAGQPWLGMGPNDGGGFCECDGCRALDGNDFDPFCNERSVTDRYIWFFNELLKGISDEFPDKKVAFYIYHTYMRPPVRHKPDARICGAFAPISLCRVHGMSNPICPDRSYYAGLMEAWGKILPELYERGYCFNLACPGFPFSRVHVLRDEIPKGKQYGMKGWRVESIGHWGSMTPTFYVAGKLMWDTKADVDALVKDFAERFFGPAAAPMHAYLVRMDAALRDADHHTGSSFNMPDFYPAALRAEARRELDEAARLAGNTPCAARVAAFRLTFDCLEAFIAMLDARNAHDYVAAKAAHDRVMELGKRAYQHNPPLMAERAFTSYMRRFWSPATLEGFARVTEGNRFVAGLPDTWGFLLDPQGLGEELGYFRAGLAGGNWRPLKTSSASWGDQGLYFYHGVAWYRARVAVPPEFAGKALRLWFGGVDEEARVWVNGAPATLLTKIANREIIPGASPGRAFVPFEYDVTELMKAGQENVVAVKITNKQVNEMGTGGITAPVMVYSPEK
jgi:hypothetical protein